MSRADEIFPTLGEAGPGEGFLQILSRTLEAASRGDGGIEFAITVDSDEVRALRHPRDKQKLESLFPRAEGRLAERILAELRRGPEGRHHRFEFREFAFRFASAGVLPLLEWEGEPAALLFWRDISPCGWNLANGASGEREELLDLAGLAAREAAEELIFVAPDEKGLLTLATDRAITERDRALGLWDDRLGMGGATIRDLDVEVRPGPDRVQVRLDGRSMLQGGFHVTLQAEDHSLECIRVLRLRPPAGSRPLDGELRPDGRLLDRTIGLFRRRMRRPFAAFRSGRPVAPPDETTLCPVTSRLFESLDW